jgi:hypothetical protein
MTKMTHEQYQQKLRSILYGEKGDEIYATAKDMARKEGYTYQETVHGRADEIEPDLVLQAIDDLILEVIGRDQATEMLDDTGEEYPIEAAYEMNQLRAEQRTIVKGEHSQTTEDKEGTK